MPKQTFEEKIANIDEIISNLESNSATLDDSVKLYNQGMTLTGECQKELETAQLKVSKISSEAIGE